VALRDVELDSITISGAVFFDLPAETDLELDDLELDDLEMELGGVVADFIADSARTIGARELSDGLCDALAGALASVEVFSTRRSTVSRSRFSWTRGKFRNGSLGKRGAVIRGGLASSSDSTSSDTGPRNALEKDLRGTRKPVRDVLPAVVEAGTLGFGFWIGCA